MSAAVILADGGGGGVDWTGLLTVGMIIVALLMLFVVLMVGTVLTVVVVGVRRVRRSPTLRSGTLAFRAATGQGPSREIARLRLRLGQALTATRRSLAAAKEADEPLGDLPAVVATLQRAGSALDKQLRLAQGDPDPAVQRTIAAALAPQVDQLVRSASEVRQAAAQARASISAANLDPVVDDLTTEAAVLRTWNHTFKGLSQP